MHQKARWLLLIIPLIFSGCAGAGMNVSAVNMLIGMGRNDKLKQQALKHETQSYNKMKQHIVDDKIERGLSSGFIIDNFGEPVIILPYPEGEKWAYKPAEANWIKGEKIYLFFDMNGSLINWECIEYNKNHE